MLTALAENGLKPVRCCHCGRLLAYAAMNDGVVLILCKNCKGWNIVAEGKTAGRLTTDQIYAMLPSVGRKA